ncbi:lmo0954 family membrane protein [Virgibacillus sp. FSP13]
MNKFLLFVGGLVAVLVLLATLGPMILLGVSIWLLYVIFKQFMKSDSTVGKIAWIVAGLFVLGIGLSNIYAVIGVAAAYVLYLIFRNWRKDDHNLKQQTVVDDDPFTNFERQWAELNN